MNHSIQNTSGLKRVAIAMSLLVAVTAVTACGDDHGKAHSPNQASQATAHADHTAEPAKLALNHGQKWKMDDHTRMKFTEMETLLAQPDPKLSTEADLKKAGAKLQVQTQELIEGCTMSGEAHNQLHAYLTGYIPAVDKLAKSGSAEDAKEVRHYLHTYQDYFE